MSGVTGAWADMPERKAGSMIFSAGVCSVGVSRETTGAALGAGELPIFFSKEAMTWSVVLPFKFGLARITSLLNMSAIGVPGCADRKFFAPVGPK